MNEATDSERGAAIQPALVTFVGSIGGMLALGINGLFVGAVVLALGYQILMAWLSQDQPAASPTSQGPI